MAGSPGHHLADPDHQQWPPHSAQICAAGAERGIDAATAPNGGYRAPRPGLAATVRDIRVGQLRAGLSRHGERPGVARAWRRGAAN
jgi:hypothetical protein